MAWLAFTMVLFLSANDTMMAWDKDRTPWVGRIGCLILIVLTTLYLRLGKAGWKGVLAAVFAPAGLILLLGLECAILGLFGSPDWESVQAWARVHRPEQAWVQEPLRPTWSACGSYCWDVRIWGEIRVLLAGGY